MTPSPLRTVVRAEALAWLAENPAPEGASVVTSLPDVSELQGASLDTWRAWFVRAVGAVLAWIPDDGVAIFYQSDIRFRGAYVDKGYLVMRAADDRGAHVLWHKIVCRRSPGTIALGRPSYSHMIAVAKVPRRPAARPGPDVLPDAGLMPWSRAMGVTACEVACRFLRDETSTRVVVDPFCGQGTALAVANALGFDAVGVDLSAKRCRAARALEIDPRARGPRGDELEGGPLEQP
ncbi:MAG: SAM-dependent methyltransferase [Myxococcales bacterium]|nr:SAM-dependent methyltransferase [Myxococcales bacterium]